MSSKSHRALLLPFLLAAGVIPATTSAAVRPSAGLARVGPYVLLEELGAGGMGEVFLAEQTAPIVRRVAVKVARRDLGAAGTAAGDTADAVATIAARFRLERQLLALVNHDHFVRLLDAGDTETGAPWFAMELVPGARITDACDARGLDLDARLALFGEVCRAVQHLHDLGIEHRDLKPDNVLLIERDGRPVPKIVDLGLAMVTGHPLAADEGMLGTPTHMAPEQFTLPAHRVDRRADVHALGVMLYELSVGALPERPAFGDQRREFRRPLPPPSARLDDEDVDAELVAAERGTTVRGLRRRLVGAFDAVARRAIHRDREQRTATASDLADAVDALRGTTPRRWWSRGSSGG